MKSKGVSNYHRCLSSINLHTPKHVIRTTAKDCNRTGWVTHRSVGAKFSTSGYTISTPLL